MQAALGEAALSYWGEGVLTTTTYPDPFPITMSGVSLGGSVGTGIAIDPNGQITEISASPDESTNFTIAPADPTNARWDLLVLSYQMVGDTPVPQPSDPINTVNLNLHDDFMISVVEGTPSGSPTYPAKQAGQIILAGLRVPAGATNGTQVTVDLGIRELALQAVFQNPNVIHEVPSGAIPGNSFTTSQTPMNANSILVIVDGLILLPSQFTLTGNTVTPTVAPAQSIDVWYIWDNPSSINPYSGYFEVPVNSGDNQTFNLSGRAGNKNSILVFVDGGPIPTSGFTLLSGPSLDQVKLNSALPPGQDIAVFYLINPASIGLGGGGGGGGGVTGASNTGSGLGIFNALAGSILEFFSLKDSATVTWVNNGDGTISASASGGGGGGSREAHGDGGRPETITPSVGVPATSANDQVWWLAPPSSSGAVPVTSSTQIGAGSAVGQRITLKGISASDYYTFQDGNGLSLNGPLNLTNNQAITLSWDGSVWSEDSRRN